MAFNPALPAANSPLDSAEMRSQLTGLKDLIDQRPTTAQVNTTISAKIANALESVDGLGYTASDPPTQAEVQMLIDKVNELLVALRGV